MNGRPMRLNKRLRRKLICAKHGALGCHGISRFRQTKPHQTPASANRQIVEIQLGRSLQPRSIRHDRIENLILSPEI